MHDASVFTGPWPFATGEHETLPTLAAALRRVGISAAAVSPARAILAPEPAAHNAALARQARRWHEPDVRFVPVPIIDPSSPCWRDHLAACHELVDGGPRAVKIVPNYHGYDVLDGSVIALATELVPDRTTLCVQLRMTDERAHHPLMKVPGVDPASVVDLAKRVPDLPILACAPYLAELPVLAPAPNVHAELSFVESGYLLRDALHALGPNRLLLGTHAPLHYPAPGVAKLTSDDLAPEAHQKISCANFARLFGHDREGDIPL